ncbi:MAG: transposase [Nitrosomonas sp.]
MKWRMENGEWRMEMELPRTQYSQEFRGQSVKFFKESGLTLVEAAKRLSLPKGTLKNWVYLTNEENSLQ